MYKLISGLVTFFICTISVFAQTIVINEVVSSNFDSFLDEDGDSPDWIEFYTPDTEEADLSGFGISDDEQDLFKWVFPPGTIISKNFFVVFASGKNRGHNHTNFKISSVGESLFLTSPGGIVIDSVHLASMPADISYGREADGDPNWFYFLTPTPGSENNTPVSDTPNPYLIEFLPGLNWWAEGPKDQASHALLQWYLIYWPCRGP